MDTTNQREFLDEMQRTHGKIGTVWREVHYPKPHESTVSGVYIFDKDGNELGHFNPELLKYGWGCGITEPHKYRTWGQHAKDQLSAPIHPGKWFAGAILDEFNVPRYKA